MRFKRPVRAGDEVEVKVVVTAIDDKGVITLATSCVETRVVVEGEAVVQARPRKLSRMKIVETWKDLPAELRARASPSAPSTGVHAATRR